MEGTSMTHRAVTWRVLLSAWSVLFLGGLLLLAVPSPALAATCVVGDPDYLGPCEVEAVAVPGSPFFDFLSERMDFLLAGIGLLIFLNVVHLVSSWGGNRG